MFARLLSRAGVTAALSALACAGALTGAVGPGQAVGPPTWRLSAAVGIPGGFAQVTGIAATSRFNAWAAASQCGPSTCPSRGLAVRHWGGRRWRTVTPPAGLTSSATALGSAVVGTSSAANAWVFALLEGSASVRTDALHWNGRHWQVLAFPDSSQITQAEVFGTNNAWAFGTTGEGTPFDVRYNGSKWRSVSLPGRPEAVSATSASDMWAIGPTTKTTTLALPQQSDIAMHWTGTRWQALALPKVRKPASDYVVTGTVTALGPRNVWEYYGLGKGGGCCVFGGLEHWTGAWHAVRIPFPATQVSSTSSDGHGGIWLTVATGKTDASAFYHFNAGHWSRAVPPKFPKATVVPQQLAWVPGTRHEWAAGVELTPTGSTGVILAS
jgi:hypothetical protein